MSEFRSAEREGSEAHAAELAVTGRVRRPPDLATRIEAEEVRLLFDLGETSRYTILGGILVVGLAFYPTAPIWATAVVLFIQLVAQIAFDRVRAGFRADPNAAERANLWARRYAAVTVVSGSTWGIGGLLWLPGASFAHHIFYALVISSLAMATAITRATYPPAVIAYIGTATAPALVLLLLMGDPLGLATIALAIMFLLTIAGWTRRVNRSYREAIRLRFENADLIERMARAHAATEQKRQDAEEAERAARAAGRAKDEFLAILGHEVKTPLEGIAHMAALLGDEPASAAHTNLAREIGESSRMLKRLFDDMIDFSQMEAHSLELKSISFDPANAARSVVRLMRPQAAGRGLSLELDLVPGTPPYIVTDPDRLKQVLVNLLSNAIKFTETGGVILRLQPVQLEPNALGLRFSVLDTGIGFTADARARLFESFAQGEGATGQHRPEGMGLGLAIADRLVRLMGGRIHLDSAPGQGSTFWFLLAQEPGVGVVPQPAAPGGREPAESDRQRLVDHDHLYELERALGPQGITDRMVAALDRILDLQRKIEAARRDGDIRLLAECVSALQTVATEIGLVAMSGVAGDIGRALEEGHADRALHDVPRLQQKISATWRALAEAFPRLAG